MITLTATINLLSDNDGILSNAFSSDGNNISADISSVLGAKKQATNPFIIGASRLGDGSTLSGNVDYYIGKELADENGVFTPGNPFSLQIYGENIQSITIEFDTINNRHPKSIYVSGDEIIDDDPRFTIPYLYGTNVVYINIPNWNTPYHPVVITGIYAELKIIIDRQNLISLESKIFERADISRPSFGIYSNSGNLTFNDWNGEIRDYAEQGFLVSDVPVMLYINNTLVKSVAPIQIAQFETDTWDYDEDNRQVSVSLRDDLEEWQEITIDGFFYNPNKPAEKTAEDIYNYLHEKTPQKYNMVSFDELGDETKTFLENIKIIYPFLENGTLWQGWTKLCVLTCSYIYKSPLGVTKFVHYWG